MLKIKNVLPLLFSLSIYCQADQEPTFFYTSTVLPGFSTDTENVDDFLVAAQTLPGRNTIQFEECVNTVSAYPLGKGGSCNATPIVEIQLLPGQPTFNYHPTKYVGVGLRKLFTKNANGSTYSEETLNSGSIIILLQKTCPAGTYVSASGWVNNNNTLTCR